MTSKVKVRRKDTGRVIWVSRERARSGEYEQVKDAPKDAPYLKGYRSGHKEFDGGSKAWVREHEIRTKGGSYVLGTPHVGDSTKGDKWIKKVMVPSAVSAAKKALKAGKRVVFLAEGGSAGPGSWHQDENTEQAQVAKALAKLGDVVQDTWDDDAVRIDKEKKDKLVVDPKAKAIKTLTARFPKPGLVEAAIAGAMWVQMEEDTNPYLLSKAAKKLLKSKGIDPDDKKSMNKMWDDDDLADVAEGLARLRDENIERKIRKVEKEGGVAIVTPGAQHAYQLKPVLQGKPKAARVASLHRAAYFSVGDVILFGKYKNKKGKIVGFGRTEKNVPTVIVEPIPKGRKKNKEMGLFKIWHGVPEKRGSMAARVAHRYAFEHPTSEARKKYLQDHPGADPKKHTVKGPSKGKPGKVKSLADRALAKVKGAKEHMVAAVRAAPAEVHSFLFDKGHRNKRTKELAAKLKENGPKAKKALFSALKRELSAFPKAGSILRRVATGGKLQKGDVKTLYGVGVYVAGTVLGAMSGGAAGAALFGASKALLHSLSLHASIKAVSHLADEGFLGYEAVESGATATGLADALPINTSDLPGLGKVFDVLKDVVTAADEKDDEHLRKFVEALYDDIVKQLEQGISDADIRDVLVHGVKPRGSK